MKVSIFMKKYTKEKIKLTTRQILLYLVDTAIGMHDTFDSRGYYYKSTRDYYNWRDFDKAQFRRDLYRLEKNKFVDCYKKNQLKYYKLTSKGKKKTKRYIFNDLKINIPNKWDYKWRVVIFDIPEDKKTVRDLVAKKLKQLGFLGLQKSVFVFPFDCEKEIIRIKYLYGVSENVQFIIAEKIETEINLIKHFFDEKILNQEKIKIR